MKVALDTLISDGVDSVKVSVLSAKLNCARSSFYWYFGNRTELLNALLDHWQQTNTQAIVDKANKPAETINFALTNVFSCWVEQGRFNTQLDFAVRECARRDGSVRRAVDISDDARLSALSGMFQRYGYQLSEAETRAKIVYFTQIGYEALDTRQSNLDRAKSGRDYLLCLTGIAPSDEEIRNIVALTGYSLSDL